MKDHFCMKHQAHFNDVNKYVATKLEGFLFVDEAKRVQSV